MLLGDVGESYPTAGAACAAYAHRAYSQRTAIRNANRYTEQYADGNADADANAHRAADSHAAPIPDADSNLKLLVW